MKTTGRKHHNNVGEKNHFWKDGRTLDKEKYYATWYQDHKKHKIELMRISKQKRRAANRLFLVQYKSQHGCSICHEHDPSCLQFHHVSASKEHEVGQMTDYSQKKILDEISKCDVLCFNCHMKLHHSEKPHDLEAVSRDKQGV